MAIRLLTEEVIGKIAAGEVVERPSAAIKELIENSLDARASAITVEIRDGGISYFRVTDNGCGIQQSDIRLAFERHATSKITSSKDLESIGTLGFRGEALASIAAVGKVSLTTRTEVDQTGLKVQNNGGKIEKIEETSCPIGTTIIVREMFFNTPVRLKFLKKPSVEAGYVSELIMHMILSRPDVSFRFINNDHTVYHSVGDGQLSSAIHSVYGSQAMKNMRTVNGCASGILVNGYVGIGELARGNRNQESFFINGRMMKSQLLSGAVEAGCRERVMIGKYPVCALHLTMPYDTVDVNVHPNKLQVRFRDEAAVSSAVAYLVAEALVERDALEKPVQLNILDEKQIDSTVNVSVNQPLKPSVIDEKKSDHVKVQIAETLPKTQKKEHNKPSPVICDVQTEAIKNECLLKLKREKENNENTEKAAPVYSKPVMKENPGCPIYINPESGTEGQKKIQTPREEKQLQAFVQDIPKPMKILGALFNTYILIEYEEQLLLVDQHAVHERLLYDRMMSVFNGQNSQVGQQMLVPIIVNATRREQDILEENRELLERMGLIIDHFGDTQIAIRSVPVILGRAQAVDFVRDTISELENGHTPGTERKRNAILQMACKRAVKGGDVLPQSHLRELVETMVEKKVTPTCPHGRPLVVAITHNDLDKKFKRIQ